MPYMDRAEMPPQGNENPWFKLVSLIVTWGPIIIFLYFVSRHC